LAAQTTSGRGTRTDLDCLPLDFWQRSEGTFCKHNSRFDARWEQPRFEGGTWELDFRLTCARV
jgi:hypothetical protein